mgnify:CR=1 FL=1
MKEQLDQLDVWVKQLEQADPTEALTIYTTIVAESTAILEQLNTLNDTVKTLSHEATEIINNAAITP